MRRGHDHEKHDPELAVSVGYESLSMKNLIISSHTHFLEFLSLWGPLSADYITHPLFLPRPFQLAPPLALTQAQPSAGLLSSHKCECWSRSVHRWLLFLSSPPQQMGGLRLAASPPPCIHFLFHSSCKSKPADSSLLPLCLSFVKPYHRPWCHVTPPGSSFERASPGL